MSVLDRLRWVVRCYFRWDLGYWRVISVIDEGWLMILKVIVLSPPLDFFYSDLVLILRVAVDESISGKSVYQGFSTGIEHYFFLFFYLAHLRPILTIFEWKISIGLSHGWFFFLSLYDLSRFRYIGCRIESLHRYSIRDIDLFCFTIVFDTAIAICKTVLSSDLLVEVLREPSAFIRNNIDQFSKHKELLLLIFHSIVVRLSDLEQRTFSGWMVFSKVVVEPNLNLTFFVDTDHLIHYIEGSHLAIAVIEASDGLTEHV